VTLNGRYRLDRREAGVLTRAKAERGGFIV
jgi:hypothetical protein